MDAKSFEKLVNYLRKVPGIHESIGHGSKKGFWWIKFSIDIEHKLAWNIVQEFAHVLNYLSIDERLPTIFKPVSPPPYMNGGPREFLSWVIECDSEDFTPNDVEEWLEGHLPNPVNKINEWKI